MNILSIRKKFKKEIDSIWNNDKFKEIKIIERGYGIHDEIIKNSILFIGINPSYKKGSLDKDSYFINLDQEGKNIQNGKQYPYFKKFVQITEELNELQNLNKKLKWSHIDLLFHRETRQSFINNLEKETTGKDFIIEQLKVSEKIILQSNPKIIIVSNTKARDYLKSKNSKIPMSFKFKFDSKLGTDIIVNNGNLNGVPVFFTSMLTGQRALDNGSYQRLIWHINYVINKKQKNY